jgi:hypothetical protein
MLYYAKKFRLNGEGNFSYFIQKNGSSMGKLESSPSIAGCIGKSTFNVTEKLTFQKVLRQGGTVNPNKGLIIPGALKVDLFSKKFFSDAAFP